MAMLGAAANTQCNRYFSGYYSTLDLNGVANGSSCALNDDVKYFHSDHCYDRFSSSADYHLDYNKEVLKNTMLKHEAVFKDQIYELHRLYKRQRELMEETDKKDRSVLEKSHPNLVFSHTSSGYVPMRRGFSWLNPVCSETSFSVVKNIVAPSGSDGGEFKQVAPNPVQAEGYCVDSDLLESKCIKSRKILFDLELPADAYINSGERVSVEDGSDDRVPEVVSYSTRSIHGSGELNSVSHGGTAAPNSLPRTINCITDLNKPIDVEVHSASESDDSGCQAVSKNMTDAHISSYLNFSLQGGCTGSVFGSSQSAHVQFDATPEPPTSCFLDKTSRKSKHGLKSSGRSPELLKNKHAGSVGTFDMQSSQVVPHVDRTKSVVSPWKYCMDDSGRSPIAVQALPCFTNSVKLAKSSKCSVVSTELSRGQVQHSNSRSSSGSASFLRNSSEPDFDAPKASPLSVSLSRMNWNNGFGLASKQHSSPKYAKSPNPPDAKYLNLNLNLIHDSCSPDVAVSHDVNLVSGKQVSENSGIEMGLKNNISVCRDHIDLNSCINEDESSTISTSLVYLEAPVIPEKKGGKDGNVEQELARSAAEAIIFISASVAQSYQEKASAEVGSLHWFAGIVVSSQAENCRDYKMCPSDEIDYFEAMTLKLTESCAQKQEITRAKPLPNQVKRGRTRRRKQPKDFQNEVLPGIASLSRNEVSKDLRTIGGLIENAHACGTRNSRSRGKRGSSLSPCSESMIRSIQKHKTSDSKMGFERGLIGWGKITKGPRRHRLPPTKPLHF